jgi:hypothetical protein
MDIRNYFTTRLAGVGSTLGVLVMASVVMIGTAQAQNAATTSNHASVSGIQSVITHTRDSVQRRMRAVQLRSQHQPLLATNPDAPDPIAK